MRMKKLLKIVAWIVGIVVGLLIVAVLVLPLVFDPNRYKDDIVKLVKTSTGRDLKIDGNIGWTVFPRLGVSTGRLTLSNAPGFGNEPFARVESTTVRVEVLPLFVGRVNVDAIVIDGLVLNLAKNAAGKSNWDDLAQPRGAKPQAPKPKDDAPSAALALTAGKLDIQRSTLTWRDASTGDSYALKNLTLETGRLAVNEPMNVKLGFDLDYGKPAKHAVLRLVATALYTEDKIALKPFELQVDESRLTGSMEIRNLASPAYRFDLALDQIDIDKYLPPPAPKTAAKPATPATGAGAAVELPVGLLRSLDIQGKFAIGKLKAFGIRSEEVRTQVSANKGLIQFGPNSAKLYSGTYSGRTTVDVRNKTPQLKFEEQLNKVQLGPLLKDADVFGKFSGNADIKLALSAAGGDANSIKRTLNGNVSVAALDGKIEGVNLSKLITDARQAYDKARGKSIEVKPSASDETAFKSLRATANVVNGVATTNDLKLEGPVLRAEGSGATDLGKETLNYKLRATVAEADGRKGTTVPVVIGGTFANPSYGVDFGQVLKQEAGQKIEKKIEKGLDKLLRKKN
jgi:AsmA protein